jgi:hypothetical protein
MLLLEIAENMLGAASGPEYQRLLVLLEEKLRY